ncbi:MAG: serine/threonine protein phosphatase [Clostridia bacterium]|nr:serine/threonine protein phosphatase [Clostridia bacterium]
MSIYTIGDLHLSFHEDKPMGIFGENWEGHEEKIKKDWIEKVKEEDIVVIPGDFSWSTYLKDTYYDFSYLNNLPGKKLILKGNHDYWWTTLTSMRNFLEENQFKNIDFIYNTAYEFENYIIAGTRGWGQNEEGEDQKLLKREVARLELSLKKANELNENQEKEILVFLHYPPLIHNNIINNEMSEFVKMMKKYDIKKCFYGHLHSTSIREAIEGNYYGIDFKLVSADGLDFQLFKIK